MITKKNILFISAGAAALVTLGLAGLLLGRGIKGLSGAQDELEKSRKSWQWYYEKNPFPTAENIAIESENVRVLGEKFKELMSRLKKGQVNLKDDKRPSHFMTELGNRRNKLVKLAKASRTALPDDFPFGFERYFAEGEMPAPADVPILTQQLVILEELCKILFDEKVKKISFLSRDVFEDAFRASRTRHTPGSAEDLESKTAAADLYSKQHFSFEFTVKENSFLRVLNRFVSAEMFIVVTSVRIKKEMEDLMSVPVIGTRSGEGALSRAERIVCGKELEKSMNVELGVDVYSFRGE